MRRLRSLELPPDRRDLPPDRALVRRRLARALLEPVEHLAHEFALRLRKTIQEDSPRHRREERVPVVLRRHAGPWWPATWLAAGCRPVGWRMLSLEPLNLGAGDQNVRRVDQ